MSNELIMIIKGNLYSDSLDHYLFVIRKILGMSLRLVPDYLGLDFIAHRAKFFRPNRYGTP